MQNGELRLKIGGKVLVKRDGAPAAEIFRVVPAAFADAGLGRISAESPLGAALLGRAAGETAEFEAGGGLKKALVVKVIPEDGA